MFDVITHPWQEPIDYFTLSFWVVIFMIVSFVIWDMLRILTSWIASAAITS